MHAGHIHPGSVVSGTYYVALPDGEQDGSQLMISFWAWGDTELETMANFDRVVKNLSAALHDIARHDARLTNTARRRKP